VNLVFGAGMAFDRQPDDAADTRSTVLSHRNRTFRRVCFVFFFCLTQSDVVKNVSSSSSSSSTAAAAATCNDADDVANVVERFAIAAATTSATDHRIVVVVVEIPSAPI
jgi:mevalonate pyrophosphate decarboxylase